MGDGLDALREEVRAYVLLAEEERLAAERKEKLAAVQARMEDAERGYLHAFQEARKKGEGSAHGSALC